MKDVAIRVLNDCAPKFPDTLHRFRTALRLIDQSGEMGRMVNDVATDHADRPDFADIMEITKYRYDDWQYAGR